MTWSYGDWHEDMVALYDDDTDQMVCWLQKKGGVDAKALALIKAAPGLLAALKKAVAVMRDNNLDESMAGEFDLFTDAIAKAEGRGE